MLSTTDSDMMMKKLKSQIDAPSCMPLESHTNPKLHNNPMIDINSKASKMCDFIWAVIRFVI